jgi:hypothetical protein
MEPCRQHSEVLSLDCLKSATLPDKRERALQEYVLTGLHASRNKNNPETCDALNADPQKNSLANTGG